MGLTMHGSVSSLDAMTKHEAIRLFGTRHQDLADALGVTRQLISSWPHDLSRDQEDRVMGAFLRVHGFRLDRSGELRESA